MTRRAPRPARLRCAQALASRARAPSSNRCRCCTPRKASRPTRRQRTGGTPQTCVRGAAKPNARRAHADMSCGATWLSPCRLCCLAPSASSSSCPAREPRPPRSSCRNLTRCQPTFGCVVTPSPARPPATVTRARPLRSTKLSTTSVYCGRTSKVGPQRRGTRQAPLPHARGRRAAIQQAYAQRSRLQLPDSAEFFFSNVETYRGAYTPSKEDILRARSGAARARSLWSARPLTCGLRGAVCERAAL